MARTVEFELYLFLFSSSPLLRSSACCLHRSSLQSCRLPTSTESEYAGLLNWMASISRRDGFQPSCPYGDIWYTCDAPDDSGFVGCCGSSDDHLCKIGCPSALVVPATFDKDSFGHFPDQECADPYSRWYSCRNTVPPFIGCCVDDACVTVDGCQNITAGELSTTPIEAAAFISDSGITSTALTTTVTKINSQKPAGSTNGPKTTALSAHPSQISAATQSSQTAPIVGGLVGGAVALAVLISFLLLYYRRHTKRSRESQQKPVPAGGFITPNEASKTNGRANGTTQTGM